MTDLTIDGATFTVEAEGDATRPALMLSNALGTDVTMWDGQMSALTKHFRVIRYDTRGHGGSVTGDAPISIARLGRDALAILDALDIPKVHWVGLSLGGAVGLWLLANAPDRIERAVLANTAPRLGTPEGWNARIGAVLADGMTDTAATTMERWFSPAFAAATPDRVDAIHALVRNTSPQGYAACCAALRDMDLREGLRSVEHEVLVVTGRHDPVVSGEASASFVTGIAGARHVVLDARHMSNIEAEGDFNAAVVAFLTAKPAARQKPAKSMSRKSMSRKALPRKSRKAMPAKAVAAKRGNVARRSNAARNPLKKAPAKRATKTTAVRTTPEKPAPSSRRAAAKTRATPRPTPKTAVKTTSRRAPSVLSKPAKTTLAKTKIAKTKLAKTVVAKRPAAKRPAAKIPTPKTARAKTTRANTARANTARANTARAKTTRAKKSAAKAPAAKVARKTIKVAARPTPPATVRGALKSVLKKTKPGKVLKAKKVSNSAPKKLPAARRKPVTKPRRPTGRRRS